MVPAGEDVKVLSISDASRLIGKGEDWLRQKIRKGEGPPARRVSANRICILHRELWQWLDSLEQVGRARLYAEPDPEIVIDVSDCPEETRTK